MEITITLKNDMSEQVLYISPELPMYLRKGLLSWYPNFSAVSHWHDDVEFIAVLSGHMKYNIDGHVVMLEAGDGIFVNSRHLHYGFSEDYTECEFICILLHPLLLCTAKFVEEHYISPLISNTAFACCILHQNIAWENEVLTAICQMYDHRSDHTFVLHIQSLFYRIWALLFEHAPSDTAPPDNHSHQLSTLKDMIGFLQNHYQEKVTLENIAAAGRVCKSNCCSLFQKYLNQTPISYLTDLRLNKSIELMHQTDMSMTEISYAVGFSGASYYTETFGKRFGCTPTQYRRKQPPFPSDNPSVFSHTYL